MDGFEQLPEALPVRIPASGLQLLQFTWSSSGTHKGVSRANLASNVSSILTWLRVTENDIAASWLPTYHDMGLVGTLLGSVAAQVELWMMSPVDFVRSAPAPGHHRTPTRVFLRGCISTVSRSSYCRQPFVSAVRSA